MDVGLSVFAVREPAEAVLAAPALGPRLFREALAAVVVLAGRAL